MTGSALRDAVNTFLGTLSWKDIFDLGGVWDRAKRIFTEPIDRLIAFVKGLATDILKFIKDAILLPLAKLAQGTRGWDLLIAVLGKNPITGDAVPQTAEALIGGFLKLIGQDEVWDNMKKANAIPRAMAWFQGAKAAVVGFVSQIPDLFMAAFKALTVEDVGAGRPGRSRKSPPCFGGFAVQFVDWAGKALWDLLELIFDVVSPGALGYIKKTGAALKSILKDPLPFVGNLVKAAKLGFQNFASHFGEHLKTGLIDWADRGAPRRVHPEGHLAGRGRQVCAERAGRQLGANPRQDRQGAGTERRDDHEGPGNRLRHRGGAGEGWPRRGVGADQGEADRSEGHGHLRHHQLRGRHDRVQGGA